MKFHFSGVCGAGMGNVACLLKEAGHEVKGSDQNVYPPMSDQLEDCGVELLNGYGAEQLCSRFHPDVQVISNVLSSNHVEVEAGMCENVPQMSFPDVLEKYILPGRKSYVVAGTHGKTTTSSILAQLLESVGAGCFVGGMMKNGTPGCRLGNPEGPFVLEGDEYDTAFFDKHSKFLHYRPQVLVLTHLEWDHVDIFPTFENMLDEFRHLIRLMPADGLIIYCGDHPTLRDLLAHFEGQTISYGLGPNNDVILKKSERKGGWQHLSIQTPWGGRSITTRLMGNIYHLNLIGAWLAALKGEGLSWEHLQLQLGEFSGARRRLEVIAESPFVAISDFAHHPTAVQETLSIVKENWPERRLLAVFDPRNATSRRNVFEERLAKALSCSDLVFIAPPPMDARLTDENRLNPISLVQKIGQQAVAYDSGLSFTQAVLASLREGDVLVVMSCGSCYDLLDLLKRKSLLEP